MNLFDAEEESSLSITQSSWAAPSIPSVTSCSASSSSVSLGSRHRTTSVTSHSIPPHPSHDSSSSSDDLDSSFSVESPPKKRKIDYSCKTSTPVVSVVPRSPASSCTDHESNSSSATTSCRNGLVHSFRLRPITTTELPGALASLLEGLTAQDLQH